MSLARTERGTVVYEPDGDVLTAYFFDTGKLSVIQGPVGSGTSSASCHKIWMLACDQAPDYDGVRRTRWLITRETYPALRKTTLETWLQWFPEEDWGEILRSEPMMSNIKRDHPSGDGTIVDCQVIFLAIPNEEVAEHLLASFEITGFFSNEIQFTDKGVLIELLSRCGRYPSMMAGPGATWYGGFADMNAPIEGHWIPYMRGDLPLPKDMSDEEKAGYIKPDDWHFYVQPPGLIESVSDGKVFYQPNPRAENQKWLKEPYIEKIKGWDKARIDRRVLNKVGLYVGGKAVYPTYMAQEHAVTYELEPVEGAPIIIGLDFGREPAAVFMQNINASWIVLSELIGSNESAKLFAPRVKAHLAQEYPGFDFEAFGDPRGADKGQNDESTAYEIFEDEGIFVHPATTDNNVEMRRSTVENALSRRNGVKISHRCITLRTGLAGGYHYRKIKGLTGVYSPSPVKNLYSHVTESFENGLMGGGEGYSISARSSTKRASPSPATRSSRRGRRA